MTAKILCPLIGGHNETERSEWSKKAAKLQVFGYSILGIHCNGLNAVDLHHKEVSKLVDLSLVSSFIYYFS